MGIKTIECAGLEADDLIGTLSARCEKEGMEVSVISGDRDLLQLATDHVKIRIPKTRQGRTEVEDYYAADVKERYQVTPSEFIDLKALMGDSSDNIPGVPGIGEKTAAKIIVEYHSIENAHAHADELKPPRAANAMKEHWDLAVMSKELATINVNAEFSYELAEAKLENIYTEEAYAWFQKLQFKNLLSRFDVKAPSNKIEDSFHEIRNRKEAEAVFEKADGAACIGACIFKNKEEVLPLFADQAQIGGIGISFSKEDHYCIRTGPDLQISWLLEQLSRVAAGAERFAIFDLKSQLDNLKIQKTSRRAVKKRRMDDHGDETRVAAGRRHHMGRICVDDQSVPGIQTERSPSREVEHLPFGNDGDLQFAVPVAADIVVLEVADIVVIDLQRKIRRPVYA